MEKKLVTTEREENVQKSSLENLPLQAHASIKQ
jgi:hypothetical protein